MPYSIDSRSLGNAVYTYLMILCSIATLLDVLACPCSWISWRTRRSRSWSPWREGIKKHACCHEIKSNNIPLRIHDEAARQRKEDNECLTYKLHGPCMSRASRPLPKSMTGWHGLPVFASIHRLNGRVLPWQKRIAATVIIVRRM